MRLKVSGVGLAAFFAAVSFSLAIAALAKITRTPDKRPDLNGVWKVLNTANWDRAGPRSSSPTSTPAPYGTWFSRTRALRP